jgi:hypothetical protein
VIAEADFKDVGWKVFISVGNLGPAGTVLNVTSNLHPFSRILPREMARRNQTPTAGIDSVDPPRVGLELIDQSVRKVIEPSPSSTPPSPAVIKMQPTKLRVVVAEG